MQACDWAAGWTSSPALLGVSESRVVPVCAIGLGLHMTRVFPVAYKTVQHVSHCSALYTLIYKQLVPSYKWIHSWSGSKCFRPYLSWASPIGRGGGGAGVCSLAGMPWHPPNHTRQKQPKYRTCFQSSWNTWQALSGIHACACEKAELKYVSNFIFYVLTRFNQLVQPDVSDSPGLILYVCSF